jgi:hypothetical protein
LPVDDSSSAIPFEGDDGPAPNHPGLGRAKLTLLIVPIASIGAAWLGWKLHLACD